MKTFQRKFTNFFCAALPPALIFLGIQLFFLNGLTAQIYEPEGLNLPGAWNAWNNPPLNNLALASSTQVPGGRVVKYSTGIIRWQTMFSVAASGGDITGGTYEWLFTSGPTSNAYGNKWSNVTVSMNTLQLYTKEGANNNSITVTDGKWYTMNFEDAGYVNSRAIFMETSAPPCEIATVSVPAVVNTGNPVSITITLSQLPASEEVFYLRYSTDAWLTSTAVQASVTGTSGTAQIPGQATGTIVTYYAFSSTLPNISADFDLLTLKLNSNGGLNYGYTVTAPVPVITFVNLQDPPTGGIELLQAFQVKGRVGVPGMTGQTTPAPGIEAWVGYNNSNSDPALWTNWIPATYSIPVSGNDEYSANLGASVSLTGTYYYATRFRLNGGTYSYGGYSATGGGFWDGSNNISGVLDVQPAVVPIFLSLENITVAAEQSICYNAKNTLTVAGNNTYFEVSSGAAVTLIAGEKILFLPGTTVTENGYLHGYITSAGEYCTPTGTPSLKSIAGSGTAGPGRLAFSAFPNPAAGDVTIDVRGVSEERVSEVGVFGIHGSHISTHRVVGPGSFRLDLTGLPAGMYLLRVVTGDKVQTLKLIKQ